MPISIIRREVGQAARRVIAKVEWHPGELYPRVGFIITNLSRPAEIPSAPRVGLAGRSKKPENSRQFGRHLRIPDKTTATSP
jgi:hypothetical protein